jgi:hypothetical protein
MGEFWERTSSSSSSSAVLLVSSASAAAKVKVCFLLFVKVIDGRSSSEEITGDDMRFFANDRSWGSSCVDSGEKEALLFLA